MRPGYLGASSTTSLAALRRVAMAKMRAPGAKTMEVVDTRLRDLRSWWKEVVLLGAFVLRCFGDSWELAIA